MADNKEKPHNPDCGSFENSLSEYRRQILKETNFFQWEGFSSVLKYYRGERQNLSIPSDRVFVNKKIKLISQRSSSERSIKKDDYSAVKKKEHAFSVYTRLPKTKSKFQTSKATQLTEGTILPIDKLERVGIQEAFKRYRRIAIWGEPGSGKSTLLRYLYRVSASDTAGPIPVFIRLRDIAIHFGKGGQRSLYNFALDREVICGKTLRDLLNTSKQVMWLIDGLDETYGYINEILRQISRLPGDIVLTSRIISQVGLNLDSFVHFETTAFNAKDINNFIYGWFSCMAENQGPSLELAKKDIARLQDEIENYPYLHQLSKSPLMLTFISILFTSKKMQSEDKLERETSFPKARLLKMIVEHLIDSWEGNRRPREGLDLDEDQHFTIGPLQGAIARKVVKETYYFVGWRLHSSLPGTPKEYFLTRNNIIEDLPRYLKQRLSLSNIEAENSAEPAFKFWVDAGLFDIEVSNGDEYVFFRHQIFQEYAAAKGLAIAWHSKRKQTWRFLCSRLHHPAWQEPFLMMGSFLNKDKKDINLIAKFLLKGVSAYERDIHRDLNLAAKLYADGAPIKNKFKKQILKRIKWLLYSSSIPIKMTYVGIFLSSLYLFCIIAHYLTNYSFHMMDIFLFGEQIAEQLAEQLGHHFYSEMGLLDYIIFPILWCFIWYYMLTHHPFRFIISLPVRIWKRKHHKKDLFDICAKIGTPAVPILIKVFSRYFQELEMNRSAGITLGKIGDQKAKRVIITAILKGDDSAVDGLMEIGNCNELDDLINSLEDNNKCKNPILVAKVLGRLGRKEGITYLTKVSASIDQSDRFQAIKALAEIGSPESLDFLIQAAEDEDSEVAAKTIKNISTITNEKALPQLKIILTDKRYKPELREAAAASLSVIGGTKAAAFLVEVMKNEEFELNTRLTAIKSLGQIGAHKISESLIQFVNTEEIIAEIEDEIISALKLIRDDTAIQYLYKDYKESNEMVYIDGIQILAWSKVPEDIDFLKRELKDPKTFIRYKRKLANALGKNTRDPEIIPFTIYRGKAIDHLSIRTLGQIGDFRGFYPILKKLRNLDYFSWKLCFAESEKALRKIVNNCSEIKKLHRASRYLWRQLTVGSPNDQLHSYMLELTSNRIAYLQVENKKTINPFEKNIDKANGGWKKHARVIFSSLFFLSTAIVIGLLTTSIQNYLNRWAVPAILIIIVGIVLTLVNEYRKSKKK